jgi:PAS domain S-box-containing protein
MKSDELGRALSNATRLKALRRSGMMDSPAEPSFDRLTHMASRFLDVPTAMVSFVDRDRQFFKSGIGLPEPWSTLRQTPLSHSVCKHVVASGKPLVIEDARSHPLIRDNRAVLDLGVAAYLGIPLVVEDRLVLGAFCAINPAPKGWTEENLAVLTDLASAAMTEIALRTEVEVRKRVEAEVVEERERLLVTLASIGDAVIVTDARGRVTFLNGVAQTLCGWTQNAASGQSLDAVFRIVNEESRAKVESPVARVLREGGVVGLANHTVLIARDGSELHIDDSAAPIRDDRGNVSGVVLVFRDITERWRDERIKARAARQARLIADIGVAFSIKESLPEMLQAASEAVVRHLDAAFARVWTLDAKHDVLELKASAGLYTHLDGPHSRVPVGRFKIGLIARERVPHLTNEVAIDPRVSDLEWARREGMVAFAGYPLVVDDRLVGVLALFARHPLEADTLDTLASVSGIVALGIERKQAEAERQRLAAIVEKSSDFIACASLDGLPIFVNEAGRALAGIDQTGPIRQTHLSDYFLPEDRPFIETTVVPTVLKTGRWAGECRLRQIRTDNAIPVQLHLFHVKDHANGQPVALAMVAHDITKDLAAQDRLREAKDAAESAILAKDAFLAALSHELRTPLAPVLLSLGALETDRSLTRDVRDELRIIRRNIEMEARLIDDLLDLTQIAECKLDVSRFPVDAHSLVHHAVNISRTDMESKSLNLKLDLSATRHFVLGDPARIQQIFWNLIKNAVKFTPANGSITVETADRDGGLIVRVIDDGIGIDPGVLPHIFTAFEQGGRDITQRFGGLGLGLAISKALVEVHGGALTASSPGKDQGSTFVVQFPEVIDAPATLNEPSEPESQPRPVPPLRILLVEDHKDTARIMSRMLKNVGHDVTLADSVASAREVANGAEFDLLISDLGLPDGSGHEIMSTLRPLPGIALSGFGMQADVQNALEAGFLGHLTKPVDFSKLDGLIRKVTALEA